MTGEEPLTGYWWNEKQNKLAGIEGYTDDGRIRYSFWNGHEWIPMDPIEPIFFKEMFPIRRTMLQSTAPNMPTEIWIRVQKLVSGEVEKLYGVTDHKVTVLWFAWFNGKFVATPEREWRVVAVTSNLPESVYFEISYDNSLNTYYIDRYTRAERVLIQGE